MDPNSDFWERAPEVFSELEKEAIRGLLQLKFLGKRRAPSLLDSIPLVWGAKRLRTFSRLTVSKYDDKEGEPKNAEEKEPTGKLKIRIVRHTPSEIVATAEKPEPVLKGLPPRPQGIATLALTGSPTSPLHGSIFMEPSDSNNSRGPSSTSPISSPRDRSLAPIHQFKVETKAVVHSSPNSRGPKKKTVAELMQRHKELSTRKEELEKERKMWVDYHELLMNKNKRLKEQLVLNSKGKEEDKFFLHSLNSSQQTMLSHSRDNQSSSRRAIIPDLNVAFEESSENSSGDFENQLLQRERIVAAAHARKYRLECLRYKQSQYGNFQSKGH